MSEVAQAPLQAGVSAGELLRRAREAAGLHVAALAVSLKVPVRKLEALEGQRFDEVGDAVFVRALASSVCRTLKVDAQPVLERLPQTAAPRLVGNTDGINAPFRAPGDGPAPTWIDSIRQPVPMLVIALVVGAVVLFLLPASLTEEKAAAPSPSVASPVPSAVQAPPLPQEAVVPAPNLGVASTAVAAPAPATVMPTTAAPVTPVLAAPTATQTATPTATPTTTLTSAPGITPPATTASPSTAASAAGAGVPLPTTGIVVLRTRGESWVEVVDAKGIVAVRKIMAPGETAGASGALPLSVTVGKADQTQVEVRGKTFDLRPVSKDNVARFEVK